MLRQILDSTLTDSPSKTTAHKNSLYMQQRHVETINSSLQITPYFVMHILTDVPGLAGLFIAVLFSGSLRYCKFSNISNTKKKKEHLSNFMFYPHH